MHNRLDGGSKISAELVAAFAAKLQRDCSKENLVRHTPAPKWAARSWDE